MQNDRRLNPYPWEIFSLVALIAVYLVDRELLDSDFANYTNIVGPIWCASVLGLGAWRHVINDVDQIWTPLWWSRIASCVFLCFGALIPVLGNASLIEYLQGIYSFRAADISKFNLIVASSNLVVFITSDLFLKFVAPDLHPPKSNSRLDQRFESHMFVIGIIFLIMGAVVRYGMVLPYEMGWSTTTLQGGLAQISNSILIAIYILTLWSLKTSPGFLPFVFAIMATEMILGILLFNKSSFLYPIIVFSLAWLHAGPSKKKVVVIIAMFSFSFAVLQPWVAYARLKHYTYFGSAVGANFSERANILFSYIDDVGFISDSTTSQQSLARFTLINVATFVINRYDRGLPGNSVDGALAILVPRALWPDKPIFNPGGDLAYLASGQVGNSISAGIYAESYWSFGWWGLLILIVPYGIILTAASVYALKVVRRGDWIHIPAIFYAMKMGIRVDGQYINDVIGASAILLGMYLISKLLAAGLGIQNNQTLQTGRV